LQGHKEEFAPSLKQAHCTVQISSGNDVLQGNAVTPKAFVPHGPEIIPAILYTEAATVPVVSTLDRFVLNGSEIQIQIRIGGYAKARLRGSAIPREQTDLP
jgi:hypothetical protein